MIFGKCFLDLCSNNKDANNKYPWAGVPTEVGFVGLFVSFYIKRN